ncbi:histidine--tRNA ligase [Arenicella xantha]|uniref:Histidine--tRNA ligase n=1 Tax=Arenicella xantha TaxID=644221 RepID=A0A395JJR4_9GAMM|nr:histidine--tRNA ligase [Arenicella xantha]RBP49291.1 histidyl-tRNA synthetase [Arenicella xantha]
MSKKAQINAVRGMNDILPQDSRLWLRVESICAAVFARHSYQQIRTPIIESTSLFSRSIGEETDIVSKEMYTFEDRNGDSLTLRPEGTASTVRAGIENSLFYNQQQRLWYTGPMFRHERPQKGRYRQFHQIGVECYGWSSPDIEAEVLSLTRQLFDELGLEKTELQINSLGDKSARASYRESLVAYLSQHKDQLDEDSVRRLTTNPLRILDSKNQTVQELLVDAPSILDFLNEASRQHFETLQQHLIDLDISFVINPRLVRGLDYYNDTVFEWVNADFGAQSTVCGGGRYDSMVEQLGGHATPGFGFGMGLERLIQILQEQGASIALEQKTLDVFIVSVGEAARRQALVVQSLLTRSGLSVQCHMGEGSMKNQFKRADKSGAAVAVIIGEQEAANNSASVKLLRVRPDSGETANQQPIIAQNDVVNAVTNLLESL